MQKLTIKLIIFFTPITLALVLFFGVPFILGDTMLLSMVIDLQKSNPDLVYGGANGNKETLIAYKVQSVNERKPEILVLGSSRIRLLPAELFNKKSDEFYNMGIPATHFWDMIDFQSYINDDVVPELVIWAFDQPHLIEDFDQWWGNSPEPQFDSGKSEGFMLNQTIRSWENILDTEEETVWNWKNNLGFDAVTKGIGYFGNGVYQRTNRIPPALDRDLDLFVDKEDMFQAGDSVSQQRLNQIEAALQYYQEQGTYVIGLFPPYAPSYYERMMEDGNYTYISEATTQLTQLFERYGFTIFDFTDVSTLGITDDNFIDVWHASERVHVQMYLEMLKALPDVLGPYSDQAFIQQALSSTDDPLSIFAFNLR